MRPSTDFPRHCGIAIAAAAAFSVLATAPARAYDDKSTISAVLELVGVNMDEKPASPDYRERPRLVLPPNRDALPQPRAGNEARPGNWPVDSQAVTHRNGAGAVRGAEAAKAGEEPVRSVLTEPPAGYRHATQDLAKIQDGDKKGSWWNPMTYLGGGGNDSLRGSVTTASSAKQSDEPEGAISSLSKMMPRFVRGSDKE